MIKYLHHIESSDRELRILLWSEGEQWRYRNREVEEGVKSREEGLGMFIGERVSQSITNVQSKRSSTSNTS